MTHARAAALAPSRRAPFFRACARVLTASVLLAVAGCAASSSSLDLAARAQTEAQTEPRGSFAGVAVPPGLPDDHFAPASSPDARTPAEDILADAAAASPEPREPNEAALRHYIRGRSAVVDGDGERAVAALEQAVEEDPESSAAWRELGEARRMTGDRFGADAAHRTAIDLNPNERRSLVRLGLDAAARREFGRAVDLLARINVQERPGDPAEPYLIRAALGQSLIETGRLAAGAELLAQGVDLPQGFSRPTLFPNDLSQLYRSQADLWTIAGDAWSRLDEPARALHAYERASELPTFDPVGLLARRLYALLATDRPATAASELLRAVTRDGLTLEDQHLRLIAYLREQTPARARIGEAIEKELVSAAAALDPSARERIAGRLALARAAALPDAAAAAALRERLAQEPGDSAAITQLLARTNAGSASALAEQVAALIEASPLNERVYTRTAIRLAGGARSLYESLPDEPTSSGGALLRARLASALERYDEAEETLTDVIDADPSFAPGVSALAELLLRQRRLVEASAVIERLDEAAGEPALLAKAQGLASLGRLSEAVTLLSGAADSERASARVAFELGALLERLGDFEDAASRYTQAVGLDPLMEGAHAALVRLYNQNGPLADREKMYTAVRDLREAIPSARTLRWLRAQELAGSGQYGAAERALRELAEEGDDPLVERALVSVWIATSSADRAEAWLREKLEDRPDDVGLVSQLARAIAAQGRHAQAASLLEGRLESHPNDETLLLQLEGLYRENLGRAEDADELTLRRLENAPPSLSAGLQEAAVRLRREDFAEAGHAVLRSLREARSVRPDELRGALAVAQTIGARSQTDPTVRPLAIGIIDGVSERSAVLPEAAHRLRTILMVLDGASAQEIAGAVGRAFQDVGDAAVETATGAVQAFVQQQRPRDASEFLATLLSGRPGVNEQLVQLWIGVVGQFPDPVGAERLIELLVDRNTAAYTLRNALNQQDVKEMGEEDAAAEIAQLLADQYSQAGDDEATDTMYRLALRYNPAHVMANNNLGYKLLSQGGDLAEAERMIETAYNGDPDAAAVVDSLGWVRYLRGELSNTTNASGEVERLGAVGLLERAVELALAADDAGIFEIHLHLGDAYWRSGQREEALDQWRSGLQSAESLTQLMGERTPDSVHEAREGALERVRAVEGGEDPPVAPIEGEPEAGEPTATPEAR